MKPLKADRTLIIKIQEQNLNNGNLKEETG